jgi:hypothetical protein
MNLVHLIPLFISTGSSSVDVIGNNSAMESSSTTYTGDNNCIETVVTESV